MPPDAEKVRQRRTQSLEADDHDDDHHAQQSTLQERICKVAELNNNEVCIEGVIFDLTNFDHPGGKSIELFGGNDVTVQYKMIHPYHTSKHLEKMKRVGKVTDYKCDYKFDTPFEQEIKREVFKIVPRGREFGTPGWFFRAFVYIAFFFYLQYKWMFQGTSIAMAIIYGLSQSAIGMNVQHDANHGACSKKYPIIGNILGLGADFIGGSKWLWMEQHWTHHAYTNHAAQDPDSFGAEPMLLFNDYPGDNPKRTWIHSFQVFYYVPVMAGYWLSSVFNPQILDLRQRGAQFVGIRMESDYIVARRKWAVFLRLLYIFCNIIAPFIKLGHFDVSVLGHILLMGASSSLGLAILFSLSHNFEGADRDPTRIVLPDAKKSDGDKDEPVDWFITQVETSCTYGGFLSGCFTGGLNFQVEHHLFPRMSSAWYPYIAPKVREICAKHGVHYAYYPWVHQNLWSTLKYLHAAGTGEHWKNNPLSGKI